MDILERGAGDNFELTGAELICLQMDGGWGTECLMVLLQLKPRISRHAIRMLLSKWDERVVKQLMTFVPIEITDQIIKAAATNVKHGEKIIQLLLQSEMGVEEI